MSRTSIKKPAKAPQPAKRSRTQAESVTVFSYVGHTGCIKFPEPIRKVSGIKRDDRLLLSVHPDNTIVLEKHDAVSAESMRQSVLTAEVRKCSCPEQPPGCSKTEPLIVSVGWSYVQVEEPMATRLGFSANAPIRLVAEKSRIRVSAHNRLEDLAGIGLVRCPP